jgi:hypothetical protein
MALTALESALQTNNPGSRTKPKRDIYERRAYAARRAAIAIDKYSRSATGVPAEKARALRWMKRWIAFIVGHGN